jgi:hypothetical protein
VCLAIENCNFWQSKIQSPVPTLITSSMNLSCGSFFL